MNGSGAGFIKFTEAFRFLVSCETQEEVDYLLGNCLKVAKNLDAGG